MIFLFGFTMVLSCDDRDLPKRRSVHVGIYRSDIPSRGSVGQQVQIEAGMSATNGCYSDLGLEIIRIDTRHYLLKATGVFSMNRFCPDEMVYQDTILYFQPMLSGEYFFQFNEAPLDVRRDTLLVD